MTNEIVKPQAALPTIELTPEIVKRYISSDASDQEIFFFIQLCKAQGLNPFLREAYLIKYDKNQPASIVVGKETFTKRAARLPQFNGFKAGIIVLDNAKQVTYREGSLLIAGEELLGGWAIVFRRDWEHPVRAEVSLKEYQRYRKDGELTRGWKEMPATMIRKVAIVQALREAFPEEFGGMYSPEEMPVDSTNLPVYEYGKEVKPAQEIAPPKMIDLPKEDISEPTPKQNGKERPKEPVAIPDNLTEKQRELLEALLKITNGDMDKALDRLEAETTFTSKKSGQLIKGTRNISKLKDVSCEIVLRQIKPELDNLDNLELPLAPEKEEGDDIICLDCVHFENCPNVEDMNPGQRCNSYERAK